MRVSEKKQTQVGRRENVFVALIANLFYWNTLWVFVLRSEIVEFPLKPGV